MPGVNPPSDGGYNYYQKTLNDLEEELKTEQKRAKQREADKTAALEESYKRNLEERDRELEETVKNVRKNANDTIASDRKYAKAEVDRIKSDTYDKYGRFNGLEADVVNAQLEATKRTADRQHEKDKRNLSDQENTFEARLSEERAEHSDEMEKVARAARDSSGETYSRAYKGQMAEYDELKQEAEKKFDRLTDEHVQEINNHRKQTERYLNETQRDFDRKARRLEDSNDARVEKLDTAYTERTKQDARQMIDSRDADTRQLRAQVRELIDKDSNYLKDKGEGTRQAIEEFNDEWRYRERIVADDFGRQIDQLKRASNEADHYYNHLNNENLHEKDGYFAKVISQVNQDNHSAKKDLEKTFTRDRSQLELQMRRDKDMAQKALDTQLQAADDRQTEALDSQAKAYQGTLDRQRLRGDDRIRELEGELNYKNTSSDTSVVSPAAESAIRKTVIKDYEKTLAAERERNGRAIDSLQQEYQARVRDTRTEKEANETQIRMQNTAEFELERSRLLSSIQDTEFSKEEALRYKDFETQKQIDSMNRSYATMLEKQRREYDDVLATTKNESSYKIIAARQEADFNLKMAQKTFTQRQNELIRDYDKKLADQKSQYEVQIDDLKSQTQLAVRENERKNKQALSEQARTFEQRLAQTEYQHKERERYIVENYQDQLEKVKRSNALLVAKKS